MTCPGCGYAAPYHDEAGRTLVSLFGPLRYERAYYYCRRCGQGYHPFDQHAGIPEHHITPAVERLGSLAGGVSPRFARGADLLREMSGVRLSGSTLQRLTEDAGRRIAGLLGEGTTFGPRVAWDWQRHVIKLRADPGATKHYLFNGAAPKEGDVIRFPALAATLKTIASKGSRAFYEGEIADDMAKTLGSHRSFLTAQDFFRHRGEVVEPISTNYRGLDLVEIPPNAQGLAALVMLNILENFDIAALDPLGPDRFHLVLEAARLGFAVRDTHIADEMHMRMPVADLLDKDFAKRLASLIDMKKRAKLPSAPAPENDTVYLTVVDRDRKAVSFINSLYSSFGIGICTEKSGIMLTNRGACFTLEPDHPNTFGPDKRPMHTIIPALAMRNGRCDMSFGVMGAHYQPMGHVQIVVNMLDYGMDVQQAIDAPRFFFEGQKTDVEHGTPAATIAGLKVRGHDVVSATSPWGGAQTIKIDWDRGVLIGGSEPRKDGCALGY